MSNKLDRRCLLWRSAQGNIALPCLFLSLALILFTAPLLLWCGREAVQEREFVRRQQLRMLCASILQNKSRQEVPAGNFVWAEGVLQPGAEPVSVTGMSSYSSDDLFHYLEVVAQPAKNVGAVQRLRRLQISFSELQQRLAGRCVLAAINLKGEEFLPTEAMYIQASTEEVKLPQFSFLTGKTAKNMNMQDIAVTGLSAVGYYLPTGTLKFPAKKIIHGTSVVVNHSEINVGAETHFPDRVVLASESSSITLGQNVRMDKALILAKGTVTLGAGCNIRGLIIAKQIILQGKVTLTPDADVTAAVETPFYPNF